MITKLNSRRIGLTVLSLMVFIVSFNLLNSVKHKVEESVLNSVKYEVEENEAKALAEELVQRQREILEKKYQKRILENKLKLKIAQLAHNGKNQLKLLEPETAKDVDVIRGQFYHIERSVAAVNYAQKLIKQSESRQWTNALKIFGQMQPIRVDQIVTKKVIMTFVRNHLGKINEAVEDLKKLKETSRELENVVKVLKKIEETSREPEPPLKSKEEIKADVDALYKRLDKESSAITNKRCIMYNELDYNLFDLLLPKLSKTIAQSSKKEILSNITKSFSNDLFAMREQFENLCGDTVWQIQDVESSQKPSDSAINKMGKAYKHNFMILFNLTFKKDTGMSFNKSESERIENNSHLPSNAAFEEDIAFEETIELTKDSSLM